MEAYYDRFEGLLDIFRGGYIYVFGFIFFFSITVVISLHVCPSCCNLTILSKIDRYSFGQLTPVFKDYFLGQIHMKTQRNTHQHQQYNRRVLRLAAIYGIHYVDQKEGGRKKKKRYEVCLMPQGTEVRPTVHILSTHYPLTLTCSRNSILVKHQQDR